MAETDRRTAESRQRRADRSSATIRDVANRAGVSVATVSRALNGIGPMTEETSQRVLTAVKALEYIPHAAARSMSIRRSNTICVLLPEVHGEFFSELVSAMDFAARNRGHHLLVSSSHNDASEMSAVLKALRGRVDGIIVMSPESSPGALLRSLAAEIPTVLLNSSARGLPSIEIDNFTGARAMTGHLIGLGHRRLAFIGGPAHNADARERRKGFQTALEAAGRSRNGMEIEGDFTEASGYDAVRKMLSARSRPTAIFAANDAMAVGAMFALREAAVPLPAGMAIAGFDDIPIARYLTPQLTTVRVDIPELGRRAVERLLTDVEMPAERSKARKELIGTTLAIRESCGSPRDARTG
jgi:LacI family transcriptional regulator